MIKLIDILNELSSRVLLMKTPQDVKSRAKNIDVQLLKKTPKGKYYYKTITNPVGHEHYQMVKPLKSNKLDSMNQDVIVTCDCENFRYENEYVLTRANASRITYSKGSFPNQTNPKSEKKLCKHLVAVIENIYRSQI